MISIMIGAHDRKNLKKSPPRKFFVWIRCYTPIQESCDDI
jgi:hypothetical protein